MKRTAIAAVLAAFVLFAAAPARAESTPEGTASKDIGEATQRLAEALTKFGVVILTGAIKEFTTAAKDHVEGDVWHGPAIDPDDHTVGGFNLKLYPKGKSQSDEHVRAETYYRLDRDGQLKEFEFSFKPKTE